MSRQCLSVGFTYLLLSSPVYAAGTSPACAPRSAEVKLARECFTGDMRTESDAARFVGADDGSAVGLNYCYNTLVVPYPVEGAKLSLLMFKDDNKGQMEARTSSVSVAALAASLARAGGKGPQVLAFKGLEARCFSANPRQSVCSKGFFGFGSTDLPFALALDGDPRGYRVRGPVRDRARIEVPGTPVVTPTVTPPGPALDFLVGQVRTRLVSRARQDLIRLQAAPVAATRDALAGQNTQFRYCRLAFHGLITRLKRPEPFAADERATLDELDRRMIDPAAAAPVAARVPAEGH